MIFYVVPKKIMISAGESSGELYGALLSRELKLLWPDLDIFGIGGPRMEAEGVRLIAPMTHIIGILEAVRSIWEIKRTFRISSQAIADEKPDVLVVIDYPDFNIALAKKAKAAGIPVLYYVSPQVWVWRSGRVNKIAALVSKMAVLFPFEAAYYEKTGLPCEFVGHPVTETLHITKSKEELKKELGLDPRKEAVSLLPGSRPNEINRHQRVIREVAEKIHLEFPDMQVMVPLAEGSTLTEKFPEYVRVLSGRTKEAVACSEAAAVASGTATLETALLGIPMAVYYKTSPVTYVIGRLVTSIRFICLVNILLEKEAVREFIQHHATSDNIFSEINKILKNSAYRAGMVLDLNKVQKIMRSGKPSARVASMVGELAGWSG